MPMVMVVDDVPVIRETIAKLLRYEGFETVCAANGVEALGHLRTCDPDVVLLDIMMPEMDGMQLLANLRSQPRWRNMPVILMSALSDDGHQSQAEQLGANEYLVKTQFNAMHILKSIRRFTEKKDTTN